MSIHSDLWEGYRSAFDYFNRELFDAHLQPCLLTLSARGNSTGFFKVNAWKAKGGDNHHEISLNPVLLNREDDLAFQTLVRCMVFLWQETKGTLPLSQGYCSDEFTLKMRELGLPCEKSFGMNLKWSVDSSGKYAAVRPAAMENFFPLENIEIMPVKGKRIKFTCPECGSKAMATAGVKLTCMTEECNAPMDKQITQ
jgi:hypothetical protein